MALEQITVKSTLPDNRLALHERHDEHPGGEAFVYGDTPVDVARTPLVQRRLADEWLVRVEGGKVKADPKATEPANPPKPEEEVTDDTGTQKVDAKPAKK